MSTTAEHPFVITANDLRNGAVVYLCDGGDWSECLGDSRLFPADELEVGLATGREAEAQQLVVGVYEIEVSRQDDELVPVRYRERIRAYGPSTHVDFVRADVPGHLTHPDGVEAVRFTSA